MQHVTRTFRSTAIASLLTAGLVAGMAACSSSAERTARPIHERSATTSTTAAPEPASPRPTAPIDELVPVGRDGARMHLACAGSGPSTVILVSGFGAAGDSWGAVAPTVAKDARVCSYTRYGLGDSDAPPNVQTFASQAEDLHQLLRAAGEPGPYVVAGHSFGGSVSVVFASRFADEVEGLLLIDASPVDWPKAACGVPDDGSAMAGVFEETCASITEPANNPERLDGRKAFAEAGSIETLGDLPLVAVTRADFDYGDLGGDSASALVETWDRGQDHWASLASHGRVVPVHNTSHNIQIDQPAVVIEQLTALLHQAHRRQPA